MAASALEKRRKTVEMNRTQLMRPNTAAINPNRKKQLKYWDQSRGTSAKKVVNPICQNCGRNIDKPISELNGR